MSNQEFKKQLDSLKQFNKEVTSTPEKARAVLVKIGVLDSNGNLTAPYKNPEKSAIQPPQPHSGLSRNGAVEDGPRKGGAE